MSANQNAAADKAIADKKSESLGTVDVEGAEFEIQRKPNALLISELARTGSGDPEAMAVFSDFFEVTLGENYPRFRKAVYRAEDPDTAMQEALQAVLEKTLGRPTE